MIRWGLQHEMIVIPKSVNPERIKQNAEVFDFNLDAEDLKVLNNMNEDLHTCWNPEDAP